MASKEQQQLLVLAGVLAVVVAFLGHQGASRMKAWRRGRQRQAEWERLYRRLELRLEERGLAASTDWKLGTPWRLRDTGAALRLELHLPHPLLPHGVCLLPAGAPELRTPSELRTLRPATPDSPGWYAGPEADAGASGLEVSPAFLDEVRRAMKEHPTLRVEPRRLVLTLPAADALPTHPEVRDAERVLRDIAQRLLGAVESAGPPSLPPGPAPAPPAPLPARLRSALAERAPWVWLLLLNGSIPLAVLALRSSVDWLFLALMLLYLTGVLLYGMARFGLGTFALVIGALFAGFGAPYLWVRHGQLEAAPTVTGISVREAPQHPGALGFRFTDGTVRGDLVGSVTRTSRGRNGNVSRRTTTATPVVPPGWTPEEPVTVFATRAPPVSWSWEEPRPLGGLVADSLFQGDQREAALAAAHKHGLRIHPQAVFLDLSVDPDVIRQRMRDEAPWVWGVPHLLWLCAALAHWRRALRGPGLSPP